MITAGPVSTETAVVPDTVETLLLKLENTTNEYVAMKAQVDVNAQLSAVALAEKEEEIASLREEIISLRKQLIVAIDAAAALADKDTEIADKDTEIADKNTEIAVKDAEIASLQQAANNAGGGRPPSNARLKALQDDAKVPGTSIALAGGDFNGNNIKLTIPDKIVMMELATDHKLAYEAMPAADKSRIGQQVMLQVLQSNNKAALKSMLPDGIYVAKKTTTAQLQIILPVYLVVMTFRAEQAAAAAAAAAITV